MIANKIKTRTQEFSYNKDRILRVKLFEGAEIKLEDAKEGIEIALQLTGEEKHFVLIDLRTSNNFTIDAKNFIAKEKENRNRIAEAFIVSSNANRLASNFYFSINKPSVPTKLFLNETEAVTWLDSLMYLFDKK